MPLSGSVDESGAPTVPAGPFTLLPLVGSVSEADELEAVDLAGPEDPRSLSLAGIFVVEGAVTKRDAILLTPLDEGCA
jgi:hypothetical protein